MPLAYDGDVYTWSEEHQRWVARRPSGELTDVSFGTPSQTVKLMASAGTALTALRSDAQLALDQSISPTWTAAHIFQQMTQFGAVGVARGQIKLVGSSSGSITIQIAPAGGSWTMTLPSNPGTSGYVLTSSGSGGVLTWAQVDLTLGVSGVLPVANGGTGAVTLAANGIVYGNGTSAVQALAVNASATNKFLTQSSSAAPAWATITASDIPSLDASKITTGILALARGGTGADLSATGSAHAVLMQTTVGGAVTVAQLAASDLSNGTTGSGAVVLASRQVIAGAGLTGGGDLSADHTITMGAPSTLTVSSANSASGTTHAHAITSSSNPGAASSLLASDSSGQLTLVNLLANTTTFNLVNATATTVNFAGAATTLNIGAAAGTVNLAGNLLQPASSYNTNIGQLSKKFLALYASELWVETLVAQNTIATIGGRVLVGPTNTLIADCGTGATTIDVKYNNLASGDRIYFEAGGAVEFMAVTSSASAITGGYRYSVTRDLDGTGANQWYAGDAAFDTGTTGSGWIDLYSVQGVKGSSQPGPTIVGNIRNSATYNDWSEAWAIGNLKGLYGYGSTTFGAGFGKYSNGSSFVTVDATNGFRVLARSGGADTVRAQVAADGSAFFGNGNLTISAAGVLTLGSWVVNSNSISSAEVKVAAGVDPAAVTGTAEAWFGKSSTGYNGVFLKGTTAASTHYGSNHPSVGTAGRPFLYFSDGTHYRVVLGELNTTLWDGTATNSVGMKVWDSAGNKLVEFSDVQNKIAGWTIGSTTITGTSTTLDSAGKLTLGTSNNVVILDAADATYRIAVGNSTYSSAPFRVDKTGALTATNATITGAITATSGSFTGTVQISSASGALSIGATPPTSASGGTGLWLDRTGLYGLSANVVQAKFDATNGKITAAGGGVVLDSGGVSITQTALNLSYIKFLSGSTQIGGLSSYGGTTQVSSIQVTSSAEGVVNLTPATSAGSYALFDFVASYQSSGHIGGYARFWNDSGYTVSLLINGSGTPNAVLDVRGDAIVTGALRLATYGAGTLTTDASGNVTASSDERLKHVGGAFTEGLAALRKIEPITFRWKKETGFDTENDYHGFSAQNVRSALPAAVGRNADGSLSLQERPLLALAINAIKDLERQVADLRTRLETSGSTLN